MKYKTILTKYPDYCLICGKPAEGHHIFKGNKQRKLADQDSLIIPLCYEHHRGDMSVHSKKEMNVLCEICGQLAFEKHWIATHKTDENSETIEHDAREAFRSRYGESYL